MKGPRVQVAHPPSGEVNDRLTRQQVLDLYFLDARSKLIDLAAFLDRVERARGPEDFRLHAFRESLDLLIRSQPGKAKAVLMTLSDPTAQPIAAAHTKSAVGAWPGKKGLGIRD